MFYSSIFKVKLRSDGYILISISTDQNRCDEYAFTKAEIEPALEDDPTDKVWSGVNGFALKRTEKYGKIRIKAHRANIIYKVSRQEIDILNAQLVEATRKAPHIERQESGVEIQILPDPERIEPDMDYLVERLRAIIKQELRGLDLSKLVTTPQTSMPIISNTPMFIPSDIGQEMTGQITHHKNEESSSDDALQAAQQLRRYKK